MGICACPIRSATASRLSPRSNCGKARKGESTQPPALVAKFSPPSLAIRAGFYVRSRAETVLFCTLLQIASANLPPAIRALIVRCSTERRPPPLRPSCAANTKQDGNVCQIEQFPFFLAFTISYEWKPYHSSWEKTYEVQVSFTARRSCSDSRNSGLRR